MRKSFNQAQVFLEKYRGCAWCGLDWQNRWAKENLCKEFLCPLHTVRYLDAIMGENMKIKTVSSSGDAPFLKSEMVPTRGTKATIVDCADATGSEFSDFFLTLRINKKLFVLGLKESGGNLRQLTQLFGDETNKWKGKKITLVHATYKTWNYLQIKG